MTKIALVGSGVIDIPPKGYGAVEKHIWNLSQALKQMGYNVTILNKICGYGAMNRFHFASWVRNQLRKENYNVVHAHTTSVGTFFKFFGLDFVYTSHSRHWVSPKSVEERFINLLERRVVKKANKVIAVSRQIDNIMQKYCKPYIIPNGVDIDIYKPNYEKRDGTNIVCLGEIAPHKKFDLVIRAAKDLNCVVTLIGPLRNAKYANYLKLTGGDNVLFTGEIREKKMIEILSKSDILVHPSISESFGMAVVEGMSCGLPVIASDICEELVTDGVNGFTVPIVLNDEKRTQIISDKLQILLDDESLRKRMSESSRRIVIERYSWEKIAERVADVYEVFLKN